MQRKALIHLYKWKEKPSRKPLIIRGARQVGKTWIMQKFGTTAYTKLAYVNFESSKSLRDLFTDDFDIPRIIAGIQLATGVKIDEKTLIVLDEIQEARGAITSLKYFHENAPEYHVIAAGSLLGVALHQEVSFPVGKVEFLDLYPLDFHEYLTAVGEEQLVALLNQKNWSLIKTFKDKFIRHLKSYYFVGGMPEAVNAFSISKDFEEVRQIQKDILTAYELDFSKHAPTSIVPRIRMLWNSIPAQLARENKKFIYGLIKEGARAKEYEVALSWLVDCGLVHQISRVSKPGIPLTAYEDRSAFKLFAVDVGLLGAMGHIRSKIIIEGHTIFEEFKGALTEQYVLQQLKSTAEIPIYYWSAARGMAEIDFVIQLEDRVIPIEVKAAENLQAKSLKSYVSKYGPNIAIRSSMSDYREEDWLINWPLYGIVEVLEVV
ncbi:MAG: ATP-binding protein [Bacteroidota bacterium]